MHIVVMVAGPFSLATDLHRLMFVLDELQDFLLAAIGQNLWLVILLKVKNKLVFN